MYYPIIAQFIKTLRNLDAILVKATHHAEAKKFEVDNFCLMRMAPDMFTFTRQVQFACDAAKSVVAGLTGREPPKHDDVEKTMAELRTRIASCVAYLETFKEEDFKQVQPKMKVGRHNKMMISQDALLSRALPNFFFHVTTAYLILRHGGVDIGKMDFLGELKLMDA